jgi:hypothetical protein
MAHQTLMRKRVQSMLFAVVLPATGAFATPPSDAPGQRFELANLTVKQGLSVDQTSKDAVMNACGELGTAAKSTGPGAINAQVTAGWGGDQYANQADPNAQNKKYGNHVTVETFDSSKPQGAQRTGRWHVYESGAVYLDRSGQGTNITYVCNG